MTVDHFILIIVAGAVLLLAMLVGSCSWANGSGISTTLAQLDEAGVANRLSATFKNLHFDSIRRSEIPGLYEVYVPGRVLYYAPAQNLLVFGEFYGIDGKSITAGKLQKAQATRAGSLHLESATAIGDGPIELVSFLDPHCGQCRTAHEWIKQNKLEPRIRERVMFMPLTGRPDARAMAASVVCAPAALRRQALDQMWSGMTDRSRLLACPEADQILAAQADEALRFGVGGTPTWVVKGQVVIGFRPDQLSSLLAMQ